MKNILPNVWRTKLSESDWNFSRCPDEEVERCFEWELRREQVQQINGGTFPSSLMYIPTQEEYKRARLSLNKDETIPDMLQRLGRKPRGKHRPQDWRSYLDIRASQNWKRIEKPKPKSWEWLDVDWYEYFFRNWSELYDAVRTVPRKSLWLGTDEQLELCPLAIRWNRRDEELVHFFRDWLKERRPKGESWDDRPRVDEPPPERKAKVGAGHPTRQAKAKLKVLAAWRLIQRYSGNRHHALKHAKASDYLGKQFQSASEWSDARRKIHVLMRERRTSIGWNVR